MKTKQQVLSRFLVTHTHSAQLFLQTSTQTQLSSSKQNYIYSQNIFLQRMQVSHWFSSKIFKVLHKTQNLAFRQRMQVSHKKYKFAFVKLLLIWDKTQNFPSVKYLKYQKLQKRNYSKLRKLRIDQGFDRNSLFILFSSTFSYWFHSNSTVNDIRKMFNDFSQAWINIIEDTSVAI